MRSGFDLTILDAPEGHWAFSYVEVTNFDGTWINLGDVGIGAGSNADFVNSAGIDDSIDGNTPSFTAQLIRDVGAYSLVPFRTDSPINVDDTGTDYSPLLDLHRYWRWWICVLPVDTFPASPADYREFGRGIVDRIDIAGEPGIITVKGRGMEADIIDALIIPPNTYAANPLPDFLQDILDQQFGSGAIPLTVDGSAPTDYMDPLDRTWDGSSTDASPVGAYELLDQSVALFGGSLRYKYDSSDVLSFTLFSVNRDPSSPDWVLDGNRYSTLDAGMDLGPIRTNVVVRYFDTSLGTIETVYSPVSLPSAASARYGVRTLVMDLAADTRVNTQARAGGLADNARSDLEFPIIEQTLTARSLWFAELGDYVQFVANGVHYTDDQYGGVTSISHRFQNGDLVSTLGFRGKPAGRYRTWLDFGPGAPRAPFTPEMESLTLAFEDDGGFGALDVVFVFGPRANSAKLELDDDPAFGSIWQTVQFDPLVSGTQTRQGFGFPDATYRNKRWYARVTPYSGPYSGGVTGVPGTPLTANAWAGFQVPTKAAFDILDGTVTTIDADVTALKAIDYLVKTATGDLSAERVVTDSADIVGNWGTAGQVKFEFAQDMATQDELDAATVGSGSGGAVAALAAPYPFFAMAGASITLTTIPTAVTEVVAIPRVAAFLAGIQYGRIAAFVTSAASASTIGVEYSTDGGGSFSAWSTIPVTSLGLQLGAWVAVPTAMQADVIFRAVSAGGSGTDTCAISSLLFYALPGSSTSTSGLYPLLTLYPATNLYPLP